MGILELCRGVCRKYAIAFLVFSLHGRATCNFVYKRCFTCLNYVITSCARIVYGSLNTTSSWYASSLSAASLPPTPSYLYAAPAPLCGNAIDWRLSSKESASRTITLGISQ